MLITLGLGYLMSSFVEKVVDKLTDKYTEEDEDLSKKSMGLSDLFDKLTVPITVVIFSAMFALVSGVSDHRYHRQLNPSSDLGRTCI